METQAKHAPTPWLFREELDGTFVIETDAPLDEMEEIAQGLSAEDAAFICRAVNSHKALVEAVNAAIEYMEAADRGNPTLDTFRAALALAGGRE